MRNGYHVVLVQSVTNSRLELEEGTDDSATVDVEAPRLNRRNFIKAGPVHLYNPRAYYPSSYSSWYAHAHAQLQVESIGVLPIFTTSYVSTCID